MAAAALPADIPADVPAAASGAHDPAPVTGPGTAAFEAWFSGSKIVADGAPLVCLHGTTADFSTFVAHAPVTVYRLDGEEIARVDTFDVEGDWTRRPGDFHYGALTDAAQLGAEAALAMREREAERMGVLLGSPRSSDPSDDTVRRLTDLRRLLGRTLTRVIEVRPSGDGHYFTPDLSYSYIRDIGQHEGGRVLPVYLAIRHPVYLNAAQIETAGSAYWVAHYRALGYDGAIFSESEDLRRRGWNGATQIVAFDAHQIKSVFNLGTYDPANPDIRFRRDEATTLPAPLPPPPAAPVAPTPFTLPPAIGTGALARHGIAVPAAQRAAAFDAWFGDSTIRRADGTPRPMFHGTTADFTAFAGNRATEKDAGWYGQGIYFTADPQTASAYAQYEDLQGQAMSGPPRVMPVHLAIQRPYLWPADRAAATTPEEARAIRAELEAAGFDGVVVANAYADPEVAPHYEVVAFHPAQIKAVHNVGTFDPASDDIRFARTAQALAPAHVPAPLPAPALPPAAAPTVTDSAEFRDWFGASRVVQDGLPQVVYHGRAADFGRFDMTRAGEFGDRFADAAFFTSSARVASGYAVRLKNNPAFMDLIAEEDVSRQRWAKSALDDGVGSPRYIAVKAAHDAVAARRQAFAHAMHTFAQPSAGANVVAAYLSLQDPLEVDAGGQLYYKDQVTARAIAQALAEGRDGVIVRNVRDFASTETAEAADVFVVFDPVNIKSVYNHGAFSRADDDIRFARSRARALPALGAPASTVGQGAKTAGTAVPRKEGALRDAAFARWFTGSMVKDEQGAPLTVFHGTNADFATFDFARLGEASDHPTAVLGTFFSTNPHTASHWAWNTDDGANLMPVHLAIRRPLELSGEVFRTLASDGSYRELAPRVEALRQQMLAGGHDGIHVRAIPGAHGEDIEFAGDIWIATSSAQIKSALGNRGTYDATDPDIRFARDATKTLPPEEQRHVADLADKLKAVPPRRRADRDSYEP